MCTKIHHPFIESPGSMTDHIIVTAFGTTTQAQQVYHYLGEKISACFPDHVLHWSYSSPTVRKNSQTSQIKLRSVSEIIATIPADDSVIVQSLHIMPGREFERIVADVKETGVRAHIGKPLLSDQEDLHRVADCLLPLIEGTVADAILLLGHGTTHPCHTVYRELETKVHQKSDRRIYLSTVEYPDEPPSSTATRIAAAGARSVLVVPLLLVAGMHVLKDICGDHADSWKNLLTTHEIDVHVHDQGLATLPGIANIFCDHIKSAERTVSP